MRKKGVTTTGREAGFTVGKGRPPLHTRFRKGRSGNPGGRPRGAKGFTTLLFERLDRRVERRAEDGARHKVSKRELAADRRRRRHRGSGHVEARPQLCPDPSAESTTGRSERSLAYQEQISGLPRALEVKLNGVRFDGYREEDGTMLEAKGPDYADKMDGPQDWKDWFDGDERMGEQMKSQADAAAAR
jgi:hypothetical protein